VRALTCITGAVLALVGSQGVAGAEAVDFIEDAKLLYRVAACGGTAPVADVWQKVVDKHCQRIDERLSAFRAAYFEKHRAWFDAVVPKTVPKTVVYPFGGGDLVSALVAFPDATEITTLSLELAGDPRRLKNLSARQLEQSLSALRGEIGGLIAVGSNTTENLSAGQRNELPAQVSSFMIGLVAGGYEPVSMRYFKLDDAGSIVYLTQADIDAADADALAKAKARAKKKKPAVEGAPPPKHDWQSPNFSLAFSNVEIHYRKIATPGASAVRVHRHIGWDLGDRYLKTHPQVIRHLENKGKVTILVKGASYLLWRPHFSRIRGYILDHLAWMLSDSTGVPPAFAKPAGMIQETYGAYSGAFLPDSQGSRHDEAFIELWKSQKKRRLPFRFGYVDMNKQAHLLVTRPAAK
jgi:hypothetical protein